MCALPHNAILPTRTFHPPAGTRRSGGPVVWMRWGTCSCTSCLPSQPPGSSPSSLSSRASRRLARYGRLFRLIERITISFTMSILLALTHWPPTLGRISHVFKGRQDNNNVHSIPDIYGRWDRSPLWHHSDQQGLCVYSHCS